MPGDEWGAAIVKAIDQCRVMVLIFSASANSSKQIRREVERAVHAGATIIPVRIENVVPTEAMAYFMSTVHWLDAMTAPLDNHLQRLAASLKALLQATAQRAIHPDERDGGEPADATADATPIDAAPERVKKPMFQEIMNFTYQRTTKQAIGWYLMYLVICVVMGFAVGHIAGMFSSTAGAANVGLIAGQISAIPYHVALGVLLLWHRDKSATNVMLVLLSVMDRTVLADRARTARRWPDLAGRRCGRRGRAGEQVVTGVPAPRAAGRRARCRSARGAAHELAVAGRADRAGVAGRLNLAWQAVRGFPQLQLSAAIAASSGTSQPWWAFLPTSSCWSARCSRRSG